MLEPRGERHIRVGQEVVCTQGGFQLEELALQCVLEDEEAAKAFVAGPHVALEVATLMSLSSRSVESITLRRV